MMRIFTDAIDRHGFFDPRYTCDIDNSSPGLRWEDPPQDTAGFALIAEDPDAPQAPFCHWVIYSIPLSIRHLPAGVPLQESLPNGIRQGINSLGKLGYTGPCPPMGDSSHHYIFKLYALGDFSQIAPFEGRPTRAQLLERIEPYVLAVASTSGRYQRQMYEAS